MQTTFESACGQAIKAIEQKMKDGTYKPALDYILIDESQDFNSNFIKMCELAVSKQVYSAGDIFQSIFEEHTDKDYEADTFLSKCYRTDSKTLMFAHALGLGLFEKTRLRWLKKEDWEACGYNYVDAEKNIILSRDFVREYIGIKDDYPSIQLVEFQREEFWEKLKETIEKIQSEFPNAAVDDFCVILLDSDASIYNQANRIEALVAEKFEWKVNKAYESKVKIKNTLLISNRNNVKGLEYPFVICVTKLITSDYMYRNAIYTMLTRSFLQTYLLLPNTGSGINNDIRNGLNEIMNSHRMTIKAPTEEEKIQIETRFNAAKQRKPLKEIIGDIIDRMDLPNEDAERLSDMAMAAKWQYISEEEIAQKLQELKKIL